MEKTNPEGNSLVNDVMRRARTKHLSIDPWAYLREALPGIFALGEEPTAEQLREWLPDRWLLSRTRDRPTMNSLAHKST